MATQTKDALKPALPEHSSFHLSNMQPGDDHYQFPDPPPRFDMQNFKHLHKQGYASAIEMFLVESLGLSPDTVVVISEAYLAWNSYQRGGWFVPDLMVAFNALMPRAIERNGYAIDDQGKPPEFVLEIASKSTGRRDDTVKRVGYANFGVQEYWRFDPSGGGRHQTHLAGDRLVDGEYQPIEIIKVDDENYRGHSDVLGLELRWEQGEEEGQLRWYDPVRQLYLQTHQEEHEALAAAEARNQELQAELERLRRQS